MQHVYMLFSRNVFSKAIFPFLCFFVASLPGFGRDLSTGINAVTEEFQQTQRVVTGKVTGSANEPLAGVSIQVRGEDGGTTTNATGNYSITVPGDTSVLVFSFVGFSNQEVTVGNRSVINISLSSAASQLDAVVVTGYGTQRKRDLTGSISSVSGEEIARLPNTNPIASLQGKVAGLTVSNSGQAGASPVVRIRGINSTNTANPVYVVDGILQDNIDYLNPADIESIDVLKDPSSIAIYGLRAANGVIAVTLKKAAREKRSLTCKVPWVCNACKTK